MKAATDASNDAGRKAVRILLALLAAFLLVAEPAAAQDSRNLFERLFSPLTKRPAPPEAIPEKPPAAKRKVRAAPAAVAQTPAVEKLADARTILVIGDFMSGGLAEGLTAAFGESPGVRIAQRANGSSGLVRDDYYDWFTELPRLIEETSPSIVAVMIGANDRQEFRTTEPRLAPGSDAWNKEYEARAARLAAIIAGRRIPFIWVGQPSYSSARMSSDMVAFNDVFQRAAEAAGGTYVDIWDGFVDETGAYVTTGPDMNGQPARLRAGDGINVTQAGRRKIAFYAEKPLRRLLGDAADPQATALAKGDLSTAPADGLSPPRIDRTVPIALGDPDLDGGTDLLGATVEVFVREDETPGARLIQEGVPPMPPSGRADDFTR
jgi:hypothetical protein